MQSRNLLILSGGGGKYDGKLLLNLKSKRVFENFRGNCPVDPLWLRACQDAYPCAVLVIFAISTVCDVHPLFLWGGSRRQYPQEDSKYLTVFNNL